MSDASPGRADQVPQVPPVGALRRAARDLARLVVPVACPGCGRWDVPLCPGCAAALDAVRRCEDDVPRLDRLDGATLAVWTAAAYAGPVRGVVLAWKDGGRADLTVALVHAVRRAAAAAAPALLGAVGDRSLLVVAVPSAPGARRRRGADLTAGLAGAVAAELCAAGLDARVSRLLEQRRGGRDQVGLGARARRRNRAGRVRLARGARPGGGLHVLVDDVVTTGATLAACEDALVLAGGLVLGAVVVAATPSPNLTRVALLPAPGAD